MKQYRIILADDHPFVLLGIRVGLERYDDLVIAGQAASQGALIELLETTECDVIVTDLSMPAGTLLSDASARPEEPKEPDGPDESGEAAHFVERIRRQWPRVRIIVITGVTNAAILRPIVEAGVAAIVGKAEPISRIAALACDADARSIYLGAEIRDTLSAPIDIECHEPPPKLDAVKLLTKREAEVLQLFVAGHALGEIAVQLERDVGAIKRDKRHAMNKLGVSNDPGLFAFVRAHGLM